MEGAIGLVATGSLVDSTRLCAPARRWDCGVETSFTVSELPNCYHTPGSTRARRVGQFVTGKVGQFRPGRWVNFSPGMTAVGDERVGSTRAAARAFVGLGFDSAGGQGRAPACCPKS